MDKQNIVSTMIKQHRTLQKEVGEIAEILKSDPVDVEKIVNGLEQFKTDLVEHLELENNVFYVELSEKMKAKGQNTTKTEEFIVEMKEIEEVVVAFLGKYKETKSLEGKVDEFKKEFSEIGQVLTLRIESEESGVYSYWGLF